MAEKDSPSAPAPVDPFTSLRSEVDRLFEDFTSGPFMRSLPSVFSPLSRSDDVMPQTDIKETDREIVVTVELPGVKDDDVSLTLQNHVLTVRGEKKSETKKDEDNYHMVERSYGSFQRAFRLPETIDDSACKADFNDGILTVTVGKLKEARQAAKRIKIGKK